MGSFSVGTITRAVQAGAKALGPHADQYRDFSAAEACLEAALPVLLESGELVPGARYRIAGSDREAARKRAVRAERALAECKEALPDPAKLRLLADLFDQIDYARGVDDRDSVQQDLRRWADAAEAQFVARLGSEAGE